MLCFKVTDTNAATPGFSSLRSDPDQLPPIKIWDIVLHILVKEERVIILRGKEMIGLLEKTSRNTHELK